MHTFMHAYMWLDFVDLRGKPRRPGVRSMSLPVKNGLKVGPQSFYVVVVGDSSQILDIIAICCITMYCIDNFYVHLFTSELSFSFSLT